MVVELAVIRVVISLAETAYLMTRHATVRQPLVILIVGSTRLCTKRLVQHSPVSQDLVSLCACNGCHPTVISLETNVPTLWQSSDINSSTVSSQCPIRAFQTS